MAGLIGRLRRITVSRIHAFLETVEDPETIFPQLVREMQEKIADARKAESKAAAALKTGQKRLDESMGRSMRLVKGAELALRQGEESLAREALAEQIRTDRLAEDQRRALRQSEAALDEAHELRAHLETQLVELKRRRKEILARARAAKKAAATYRHTDRIRASGSAILDEVSRMQQLEESKELASATPGTLSGAPNRTLEERLRSLERDAEVERRLNSIIERKKTNGTLKRS